MRSVLILLTGLLLGAAGVIGGYFYFSNNPAGDDLVTLVFTEEEIQERIGRKFPKEEELLKFVKIIINEPEVTFRGDENRIQLSLNAQVVIPFFRTDEISGVFSSSIRYEKEDHTLRTSDYTVESLKTEALPEKYEGPVRAAFSIAARQFLDDQVVHTLKTEDYQGKMTAMVLQKIEIEEGRLEVILGL